MQKNVLRGLIILSTLILGIGLQSCSKEKASKAPSHLDELQGIWKTVEGDASDVEVPTYYIFENKNLKVLDLARVNGNLEFDYSMDYIITEEDGYTFKFKISDKEYEKGLNTQKEDIEKLKKKLETATDNSVINNLKNDLKEAEEDLKNYILYAKQTIKMDYSIKGKEAKMKVHMYFKGKERSENIILTKIESLPEFRQ
ncbi:MAG: hypothetical protein N4A32_00910 [Marinifilaceae bacterium]|jgi:hypothetical protein|nr:hypothetical protein [Marinifilaceae bacterium]